MSAIVEAELRASDGLTSRLKRVVQRELTETATLGTGKERGIIGWTNMASEVVLHLGLARTQGSSAGVPLRQS